MEAVDQINHDVWLPFRQAYRNLDLAAFLAIHARDFVRVESGPRWIDATDFANASAMDDHD